MINKIEKSFTEFENLLLKTPSKEDLEDTKSIAEQNHKIIANLHNLKKKKYSGKNTINSNDFKKVKKLAENLLSVFVNIDYSDTVIQSKLRNNSLS